VVVVAKANVPAVAARAAAAVVANKKYKKICI
jgi:hypothetical protein